MKKLILIAALMIGAATAANAQVVWGVRVGANYSTMKYSSGDGDGESVKGKPGIDAGVVMYYTLKSNIYLNTGLLFSMDNFELSADWETYKERLNFLTLPVYAGYAFTGSKLSPYIQAGPYFSYKISEKSKYDANNGEYSVHSGWTNANWYNNFNAGVAIAAGVNINRFKVELGYKHGLSNIANKEFYDSDEKITIGNTFLGVSYVF